MATQPDVSQLDFNEIKQSLMIFLQSSSEFSDYNFAGSALNYILDVLAYNTHYNAIHTNLAFAETFLDSAVQRSSVVSRAKEMGYTPTSKTASKATVRLSFSVGGSPAQYVIPKATKFSALIDNVTFTFSTIEDVIVQRSSTNTYTTDLDIYEGRLVTYRYIVDGSPSQRFVIPSVDADTRFLTVEFRESVASTALPITFENAQFIDIGSIDSTTPVYLLKESYDQFYELTFGDGVVGKLLQPNNVLDITYIITAGKQANNCSTFTLTSSLPSTSSVSVALVDQSAGGADRQSVDSIKYLAPFYYQAQNRVVTENDYLALIKSKFGFVEDVSVWGGEQNNPPFYGKVFVAIKPVDSSFISSNTKQQIADALNKYNVMSVRPEIVDPDYIGVTVSVVATYDSKRYNRTGTLNLDTVVRNSIKDFFANEANKFGKTLSYSKLVNAVQSSSGLITLANINLRIQKSVVVFLNSLSNYAFDFNNAVEENSVESNALTIDGQTYYIKDIPDGLSPHRTGTLIIYRTTNEGGIIVLNSAAGTIDYNTGLIQLTNIKINDVATDDTGLKRLSLSVAFGSFANSETPSTIYHDFNVYTNEQDQLIVLKQDDISVTLLPDSV